MSDLKTKCAACGLPGHRYGRNEGMDRYDPMACINQLRGVLEDLLANGQRVEVVESKPRQGPHGEWEQQEPHIVSSVIEPARCLLPLGEYVLVPVSKLLIDPTTEEE